MKKLLFILSMFMLTGSLFAQLSQPCDSLVKKPVSSAADVAYQIPDVNFVGFGGAWANPKNMNNSGSWNGIYGDIGLTKQELGAQPYSCWQLALFGVASWSRFEDNLSYYSASSQEFGGGINFGYYSEALFRPIYAGLSLGIKRSNDEGKSVKTVGVYQREQTDWLLSVGLNLQLISRVKWFNRSQLEVKWETPIVTSVAASWNHGFIKGETWNREYADALLRQSIVDVPYKKMQISPKILLRYSYSAGDTEDNVGIGIELSIKKTGEDDFISCYYLFNASKTISMVGAKINFALL